MAAVAAEAAATTASGDGGEAEPEPEPIPGREAGAIHLVPCSAPAVASSEPLVAKAEELPPQRQQQLRAAPVGTRAPELSRSGERESPQADVPEAAERSESERPDPARGSGAGEREAAAREGVSAQGLGKCGQRARTSSASKDEEPLQPPEPRSPAVDSEADPAPEPCRVCEPPELACAPEPEPSSTGRGQEPDASIGSTFPRGADPLCSHAPEPLRMEEPSAAAEPPVPDLPPQKSAAEVQPPQAGTVAELIPGSAVWVTLDHIIEDALVVSFQLGERIFSGVLMDLSKRFGPHGIPVTIFPKREYKDKPEAIQLQSKSFQEDTAAKCEEGTVLGGIPPVQVSESSLAQNQWTSKPPPLFHEGAPYPPPLFIRDTYNQSIPQPPPRKIKRPKRKIYREEPPSIMNAIKLRPRQVLCDKCKNSIVADKKEIKRGSSDFSKHEESRKRRHDNVATVNKKLKTDHRVDGKSQNESHKRNVVAKVPTLSHSRGRVVRVSAPANTSKAQLHTKKVLQSKNMDHIKAREVLKMAKEKAQRKQRETSSCKSAHPKVHFTRRCQNTSSGTLPPRLRLKPQRYRNEENDSSLKTGLERVQSSKMAAKPQPRYTSTRSAGEAPSKGPEEASIEVQDTSEVCVPLVEQEEQQPLGKRGRKSNITVYMTLKQKKPDSSSASVCSSDSTDDLKSSHSECSSTENFDFPPGNMHAPSSSSSSSSSSSKEDKKLSNSLKIKVFSKNVSKCVTPDGRTICVGDIVWAKIYGFPWWPARILSITVSRKDNGLLVRQEARIAWFGSPTTSFLALSQLCPFLENFQLRFNKKRKGLYRKAITEAAKAAKQLTPEVRALLTQFET